LSTAFNRVREMIFVLAEREASGRPERLPVRKKRLPADIP
jgi:hypothetical protein